MENIFLGIDGCKAGWATVEITSYSKSEIWGFYIFPKINSLFEKYYKHNPIPNIPPKQTVNLPPKLIPRQVLIDIPIGLKESGPEERKCDKEARKYLGPKRGSSVFRVPARKTVYCNGDYRQASYINYKLTGKKISKQTWHISKKIREVDTFIDSMKYDSDLISVIHESHPEICFESLAGKKLTYSKKTKEGFNERMEIIRLFNNDIDNFVSAVYKKFNKTQVKPDDLLDAAILAITAKTIHLTGKISRIPEEPEIDNKGLRMEILFSRINLNALSQKVF